MINGKKKKRKYKKNGNKAANWSSCNHKAILFSSHFPFLAKILPKVVTSHTPKKNNDHIQQEYINLFMRLTYIMSKDKHCIWGAHSPFESSPPLWIRLDITLKTTTCYKMSQITPPSIWGDTHRSSHITINVTDFVFCFVLFIFYFLKLLLQVQQFSHKRVSTITNLHLEKQCVLLAQILHEVHNIAVISWL